MTKISDIYDALDTAVSTALGSTYTRLPNPYSADENSELYLKRGYGIAFGAGANDRDSMGGIGSYIREFVVVLVNQVTTTDHNVDAREVLEKSFMEDHYKVWKALELDADLGGSSLTTQVSDSGIEFAEGDRKKYFLSEFNVEVKYHETLV